MTQIGIDSFATLMAPPQPMGSGDLAFEVRPQSCWPRPRQNIGDAIWISAWSEGTSPTGSACYMLRTSPTGSACYMLPSVAGRKTSGLTLLPALVGEAIWTGRSSNHLNPVAHGTHGRPGKTLLCAPCVPWAITCMCLRSSGVSLASTAERPPAPTIASRSRPTTAPASGAIEAGSPFRRRRTPL